MWVSILWIENYNVLFFIQRSKGVVLVFVCSPSSSTIPNVVEEIFLEMTCLSFSDCLLLFHYSLRFLFISVTRPQWQRASCFTPLLLLLIFPNTLSCCYLSQQLCLCNKLEKTKKEKERKIIYLEHVRYFIMWKKWRNTELIGLYLVKKSLSGHGDGSLCAEKHLQFLPCMTCDFSSEVLLQLQLNWTYVSIYLFQNSYGENLLSFLIMKDDHEKPHKAQNSEAHNKKKL